MIINIQTLSAVKIIKCLNTNSLPLLVLCDDNESYVIKTMFKTHPPYEDLINEILCNYFFQCWDIPVPEQALIIFDNVLIKQYIDEGNSINKKYIDLKFNNHCFYGTKFLQSATEIDLYNIFLKNKHDYNKYYNPIDLIKIGVFDKWIANMDRRPDNPNILMETYKGMFRFIPIDNTQAFACQHSYKSLNKAVMETSNNKSILSTPITKSISKFANSKIYSNLAYEINSNIDKSIQHIDTIFENIPAGFGLSKDGKKRIKEILSDKVRNKKISNYYIDYLK